MSSNGTFFEEVYAADSTLYDVEQSVKQGLACVMNVDEACAQLEILMDRYMMGAGRRRELSPEENSMTFLTAIELFVALDMLAVKELPMLTDYSPEIHIAFLERLLLRKTDSLQTSRRKF